MWVGRKREPQFDFGALCRFWCGKAHAKITSVRFTNYYFEAFRVELVLIFRRLILTHTDGAIFISCILVIFNGKLKSDWVVHAFLDHFTVSIDWWKPLTSFQSSRFYRFFFVHSHGVNKNECGFCFHRFPVIFTRKICFSSEKRRAVMMCKICVNYCIWMWWERKTATNVTVKMFSTGNVNSVSGTCTNKIICILYVE